MPPDSKDAARLEALVSLALEEDLGRQGMAGDITSTWFLPTGSQTRACITAREPLVLAGMDPAQTTFRLLEPAIKISAHHADGAQVAPGEVVMEIEGPTRAILAGERTALNFLQHLSGVATLTRQFVEAVAGTSARILDTRKTLPGWRLLQKAAVRAGGGTNHRSSLHEMAMLKDNHLAALRADGASMAEFGEILHERMQRFREAHPAVRIEVEADTVEQALLFFGIPEIAVVLLDNMALEDLRACVAARPPGVLLEASGGITLETARAIAETGVDFLSIGALTHSVRAVDLGMDFPGPIGH